MRAKTILTLILACVFTYASAKNEKEEEYKHNNCYNFKRAIEEIQNDNNEEAIKYFNAEIAEHSDCDRAYQQLAIIYGNQGENGDALTYINQAIKYCPKKDNLSQAFNHYVKAKVMENLDRLDEAEAEFTESIKLDPENSTRYAERGMFYYTQKKHEQSYADYQKASELEPGFADYVIYMGINMEAMEKYQEAFNHYEYAFKLAPNNYTALAYKGDALLKLKKYNDAINCYIEALNGENFNKGALDGIEDAVEEVPDVVIAKLKAQHVKSPKEQMWTGILASILYNTKKYEEAAKLYNELLQDEPEAPIYAALSDTHKEIGNYQQALDDIDKALELNPDEASYLVKKALLYLTLGDYDKAIEATDSCIELNPDVNFAYAFRSSIYQEKKDYDKALADINTAINLGEATSDQLLLRARVLQKLGKTDEAKNDFEAILADSAITFNMPYANLFLGNMDLAFEQTDSLVNDEPDNESLHYNAACIYSLANKKEEALKHFEKSLEGGYNDFMHIKTDDDLDNIRETPEFKALVKKYEDQLRSKYPGGEKVEENTAFEEATCEVPYTKKGGVTQVKCQVNGLPLHFIFDTGASTISISSVEAMFMLKNEYLTKKDIVGSSYFTDANGDISEGTIINLKEVKIGDAVLKDVRASVVHNQKAPLLLGQSAFQKFGKIEIDNTKKVVTITYKKEKANNAEAESTKAQAKTKKKK